MLGGANRSLRPMTEVKQKFANFPDAALKVAIGANINAGTSKTLTRMSIGTYEMSFTQQEKGTATCEAVRVALNTLARSKSMQASAEASRDFLAAITAQNAEQRYQAWVTTPFEPTQANHIVWAKYTELSGEQKVGVAFKLANSFSVDDVLGILKTAEKNAVKLEPGDAFTLKGNPPPRFQKKKPAEGGAPAGDASSGLHGATGARTLAPGCAPIAVAAWSKNS